MGNGCHHKHHHHLHQQSFYNKNTFLPLLCRVSVKDVRLRDRKDRAASISEDPCSPKVSCMGQVKKSHQLIDFSTSYRLTMTTATSATATAMIPSNPASNRGHFRYTKLKRLFSGKNLQTTIATASTAATSDGRSRSCREIIMRRNGSRRSSKINNDDGGESDQSCRHQPHHDDDHVNLNISELDPPLPVIKKVPQPSEINLWKRRSGGLALRNLQIEQIHVPKHMYNHEPATTV